jgi:ABC-type taurine transport system substrate-binding protein
MEGVQEGPVDHGGVMKYGCFRCNVFALFLLTVALPFRVDAASAPSKVIFTFGGLSERSGVLFVAADAGLFHKHGLEAQVVNVRSGQVGTAALASGETQFHAGSATGASIGAMAGGLDLVFIAGLINKLDGTFVVNPSIKTPAELKGKTIAVQSIAAAGYEMMKILYDRRIFPNVEGLRNVINLLGRTNEQIRRVKVEDIIDDRVVRKLEKEGLFGSPESR